MFTNADITVYSDTGEGYKRHYINAVFWDDVKASNLIKSGMTVSDSVSLYIPKSSMPDVLKFREGKDLIVKGKSNFEFDNMNAQSISQSLKELRKRYRVVMVSVVDEKFYGREAMQHIELLCK